MEEIILIMNHAKKIQKIREEIKKANPEKVLELEKEIAKLKKEFKERKRD